MLSQSRIVRQGLERVLALPFVGLLLLTGLFLAILVVALVVATAVGPQLAHAAASHVQSPSIASIVRPMVECPNGIPTC